jgi:hypothetical protein
MGEKSSHRCKSGFGPMQVSPPQEHVVLPGSGYPAARRPPALTRATPGKS